MKFALSLTKWKRNKMNFIIKIFDSEIVNALGWTLIHSLWQSTAVAVSLAIILLLLHKRSAAARYSISFTALILVFGFSLVTFKLQYNSAEKNIPKFVEKTKEILPEFAVESNLSSGNENFTFNISKKDFQKSFPIIITIWITGFIVLLIKYLGGIVYAKQLKTYKTFNCNSFWQEKVIFLKKLTGVDKPVKMLESAITKVPMVIGYFRPVILMPLGTLASIPAEQIESIILHELAHIKNRDYLINLFQKLIETIFFFNPIIWWISSVIEREREYCCDDTVISLTNNPTSLARALSNIYIINKSGFAHAMMLTGNKHKLLGRIKRMNSGKKLKSTLFDSLLVGITLLLAVVSTTIYGNELVTKKSNLITVMSDSGVKTYFFFKKIDGNKKEFEIKTKDGNIILVKLNGVKLSKSRIEKLRDLIENEIYDINAGRKKTKKYHYNVLGEDFDFDFNFDFDFDLNFDETSFSVNLDKLEDLKELKNLKNLSALKSLESLKELENLKELQYFNSKKFHKAMKKLEVKLGKLNIDLGGLSKKLEKLGKRIKKAKKEMVKDGLIDDVNKDVSINFKNNYLYIDGKKQSKSVSRKYKKIFDKIEEDFED